MCEGFVCFLYSLTACIDSLDLSLTNTHMSMFELKVPPVILVLLAAISMWLGSLVAPSFTWSFPYKQVVALTLAVAGGIIIILGVIAFQKAHTTVNPTNPQSASSLVSSGIYQISRNPMYVGFLFVLVGLAVFFANALSLVVVPAFVAYMNRFQIAPEERALTVVFGQEFTTYTEKVRRWV
jgi:protein-S-isoprenylcysteine O-methyltransferase Ste14